ncbi:hypothetical protein STIAU_2673, partial [Stigmatella aurantiaca DW4/3-1]
MAIHPTRSPPAANSLDRPPSTTVLAP